MITTNTFKLTQKIITPFLILFSATSYSQSITLNDIPLTWNDFNHVSDKKLPKYNALTHYNLGYKKQGNAKDSVYQFTIYASFDPEESLVRKSFLKNSNESAQTAILNHEKGHYVIALIQYKKICNVIKAIEDNHTFGNVDSIFHANNTECNKRQFEYDLATLHGLNKDEQYKWKQQIIMELNELYNGEKIHLSYENSFTLVRRRYR